MPQQAMTAAAPSASSPSPSTPVTPGRVEERLRSKLANQGLYRFQDVFWAAAPDGDPTAGVAALHQVFAGHLAEAETLIALVKARVEVEEMAAERLSDAAAAASSSSENTLGGGWGLVPPGSSLSAAHATTGAGAIGTGRRRRAVTTSSSMLKSAGSTLSAIRDWVGGGSKDTSSSASSSATHMIAGVDATTDPDFGSIERNPNVGESAAAAPTVTVEFEGPVTGLEEESRKDVASEDAASIAPGLALLRNQMTAMAHVHRRHADTLTLAVLSPLTAFVDQHRRALNKKKAEVDLSYKELVRIASVINSKQADYFKRARLAEEEDVKFRLDGEARSRTSNGGPLAPISFGTRSVGPQEFHDIVNGMKRDIRTKTILTPLGMFEGCFIGEDAVAYLHGKFSKVPRPDIRHLLQQLLSRRAFAAVVGGRDGKFSTALPYMFGPRAVLKTGEPPHVKARKDAEVARLEYKAAVDSAEHTRGALEFHITDYLVAAQEAEVYRLCVVREALLALESAQVASINAFGGVWVLKSDGGLGSDKDVFSLAGLLNCPSPADGVEAISLRCRTGYSRIPPFVFESLERENTNGGPVDDASPITMVSYRTPHQIFGIDLDELALFTSEPVPDLIRHCISALTDGKSSIDTWIMPNLDLPAVQFLRHEINRIADLSNININASGGKGGRSKRLAALIKRQPSAVVAGVLRLFFIESPVSLVSPEVYEPLKLLYDAGGASGYYDPDEVRLKSVESLLATLSEPHYETLRIFVSYLHVLTYQLAEADDRIPRLCHSLAPIIIRPMTHTSTSLADTHPYRFTMDLIKHHRELLTRELPAVLMRSSLADDEGVEDVDEEGVVEFDEQRRALVVGAIFKRGPRARAASLAELRGEGPNAPVTPPASPEKDGDKLGGGTNDKTEKRSSSGWFSWGSAAKSSADSAAPKSVTEVASNSSAPSSVSKRLDQVVSGSSSVSSKHTSVPVASPITIVTNNEVADTVDDKPREAKEDDTITVRRSESPTLSSSDISLPPSDSRPEQPAAETAQPSQPVPPSRRETVRKSSSTSVSVISIASSVMYGLAAAAVSTVTAPPSVTNSGAGTIGVPAPIVEENEEHTMDAEEAALWAQAAAGEAVFFDGNEVEAVSDDDGDKVAPTAVVEAIAPIVVEAPPTGLITMEEFYDFPSNAQDMNDYLNFG